MGGCEAGIRQHASLRHWAGMAEDRPEMRPVLDAAGVAGFVLVPGYWKPNGLFDFSVSAEDFLFMFNSGILAWLSASWLFGGGVFLGKGMRQLLIHRSLLFVVPSFAALAVSDLINLKIGILIPTVWAASALVLFQLHPELRVFMISGALTFGVIYFIQVACVFAAAPTFAAAWNYPNLIGGRVCGVPLDEILWAAGFGAVWPAFLVHVTQGGLSPRACGRAHQWFPVKPRGPAERTGLPMR